MKKIIFFLVLAIGIQAAGSLHAQRVKYYYYPSSNVYYNPGTGQYVYYENNTWTPVKTLPTTIRVTHTPRYVVYHNGPDVWMDNPVHVKKYKVVKLNGKGNRGKHLGEVKHEKHD